MSTIFKESDVIPGKTEQEILHLMGSEEKSLEDSNIVDEDNDLFYVANDLTTTNKALIDYYLSELHYGEMTHDDIKGKLRVYTFNGNYYTVWYDTYQFDK